MRMILKIFALLAVVVSFPELVYRFKNPGLNLENKLTANQCIYNNDDYKTMEIDDWSTGKIQISYIEHSSKMCVNPNFPTIRISPDRKPTAWLQVIRTDGIGPNNQSPWTFIDTTVDRKLYPFYSRENDFYDTPLWSSTFFFKPLQYWRAHTYAVIVDSHKKEFEVIGGIEWGYGFQKWSFGPSTFAPRKLDEKDWQSDWTIFSSEFSGYSSSPTPQSHPSN